MRGVHLKRKLKSEKVRVELTGCYIAINTQGNTIVSVIVEVTKCITSNVKSQKFLKKNLLILKNFSFKNSPTIQRSYYIDSRSLSG